MVHSLHKWSNWEPERLDRRPYRPACHSNCTHREGSLHGACHRCKRASESEKAMTFFLDVRTNPVGGPLGTSVSLYQGSNLANYASASRDQIVQHIQGRHVLIGTHGF